MNAGRSLGHLVREAISNVFDAPNVSVCRVTVEVGHVVVEDDSPQGIKDKELITTVFLTDKEDSAVLRGRKGRGLKELISASHRALVETVGHAIEFQPDGQRLEVSGGTQCGTRVEAWNQEWTEMVVIEANAYLEKFMPPEGISFILNKHRRMGTQVQRTIRTILPTQHIVNGVQRDDDRATEVLIRGRRDGETQGMIYEMGIPICSVNTPFHSDIQQRVPLNDNRDQISDRYKRRLHAAIIDDMIDDLSQKVLRDEWVLAAITGCRTATQEKYAKKLAGEKIVLKGTSKNANDRAKQEGFELFDIESLPESAQYIIERFLPKAERVVEEIEKKTPPVHQDELRDTFREMVSLYEYTCRLFTGIDHTVSFMKKEKSYTGRYKRATYDEESRTIRFNTLYSDFHFDKPLQPTLVGVFMHELAHFRASEHDEPFMHALQEYSGLFAQLLWDQRAMIEDILGGRARAAGAASSGKRVSIPCQWPGCPEIRMVAPQDAFQVKYCVSHQKESQRMRAKKRRQGI